MNYIFEMKGGIGKHICFTSFIKWINEKYPKKKIIVISPFPEIFEYNPRIYRNLSIGQNYLFEDYIKNNDYREGDPYKLIEYYRDNNKMNINKLWPKAYRFNFYNLNPQTELYLTPGEDIDGEIFNKQNPNLITLQPFGGMINGQQIDRTKIDSNQRDMGYELAIKITDMVRRRGFQMLQIRSQGEPMILGTIQLNLPFRNLISIAKYSKGHIGIDSSFMHANAAFNKPQLIFWGNTHKDNLGYDYPGFFNAFSQNSMYCRPHVSMPDREGLFPYRDKRMGKEFEYSDQELSEYINKFLDYIQATKNCKEVI